MYIYMHIYICVICCNIGNSCINIHCICTYKYVYVELQVVHTDVNGVISVSYHMFISKRTSDWSDCLIHGELWIQNCATWM